MLIIIISRSSLKLDHVGSKTRLLGHQATQVSDLGPLWPSCLISAALQALKRKRRYEKQLQDVDANLSTVEFQREALENACSNTEVLRAMSSASNAVQGQSHRTRV